MTEGGISVGNILDYLDWRGDIPLGAVPFNEVDNLILSELSYLDFNRVVPTPEQGGYITVEEAARAVFERYPLGEKIDMGMIVPDRVPDMLKKMQRAERFRHMLLSCYVDHVDTDRAEQFSALTVDTGDGHIYCAYRGTDDTLAGWKEDLEMTCRAQIPAQKMALDYLRQTAGKHPRRRIRMGGHSKGGNLAVYAGVFSPLSLQRRITAVWSNDGPGFHNDILALPEHERLQERIFTIVPRSSIVGMLLEHEEHYTVVDSDSLGLWQHDGFSWQVMGGRFIRIEGTSEQSRKGSQAVRAWVHSMTTRERQNFVDALFKVMSASGAETLTDLKEENIRAVVPMLKAMKGLDRETREGVLDFVQLLMKTNARLVLEDIQDEAEKRGLGRRVTR